MGFREWFGRGPSALEVHAAAEVLTGEIVPGTLGPDFAIDTNAIDTGVLYGTPALDDWIFNRLRISRAEALRVPAVKRARDLICGGIGQFPLRLYDPAGKPVDWSLLDQPESGIARSVTLTNTVEDMLLFKRSWWQTTHLGWHNKPAEITRLDAETVTVRPTLVRYPAGTATVWPETPGLIRIESPNEGLLEASPAIRACVALDRAALNAVDGAPPIDYFTPADPNVDPFETDEETAEFLDDWRRARQARATGFVPGVLKYNVGGWDPEKLQLAAAREFAILEVARLTGIDAEDLSVSTTSRTYANMQDRRRHRVEDVLGPYMTAIEGRLGMDDVTPRGYTVAFDTASFLRLDDLAAAQADKTLIDARVLDPEEARVKRGLDPRTTPAAPATAEPAPQEIP